LGNLLPSPNFECRQNVFRVSSPCESMQFSQQLVNLLSGILVVIGEAVDAVPVSSNSEDVQIRPWIALRRM
jgi:hypothetical protein